MKLYHLISVILISVISFFFTPKAIAQNWNKITTIPVVAGISVEWRLSEKSNKDKLHLLEWRFMNYTDSAYSSMYRITTDREEYRIGRIKIPAKKVSLSGWYFAVDAIRSMEFRDGVFLFNQDNKTR